MNINFNEVRKHVDLYFKEHLPQYTVLEIRRKSNHPDDAHLWMVSAMKSDGTYAVWTGWNEAVQSLNHGHYDLKNLADCKRIFDEHQNIQQYFEVYKYSQNAQYRLFVTDSEKAARNYCETQNWELKDENEFVWNLNYRQAYCPAPSSKEV